MKNILIAIGSTLLLAACGGSSASTDNSTAGSTTGTAPPTAAASSAAPAPADAIKVSLTDFKITPAAIPAKAGSVSFAVSNDGKAPHNLTIFAPGSTSQVLKATATLGPGQTAVLTVTLAAGKYHFNCSVPGHESLGMTGDITVS
ncbi:MAG: hypothetical protein NVS9B1_11980 [Candidatus Dormibacteraceae bacterium]